MQNEMPFYEGPESALTACVQALGGAKIVGPMLWPEAHKTTEQAHKALLDCLNPERSEKLSYSQIIYLFRKAKQAGFHAGYDWWSQQCEYSISPISQADQEDRALEIIEKGTKALETGMAMLARSRAST